MSIMSERQFSELSIKVYDTRDQMGKAAAKEACQVINSAIASKGFANVMFAAAPSQNEFLENILTMEIDWNKVNALHMDEYIGLPSEAPQRFGNFLKEALFSKATFRNVFYMNAENKSPDQVCSDYTQIFHQYQPDLICAGVGENGHLAFNDPPTADFNDPQIIKVVKLDLTCRTQQVNDGCFAKLEEVPTHAVTVSMSALLSGIKMIGIVPGKQKAQAIKNTAYGPISTECPASGLRNVKGAVLYVDRDAGSLL